MKTLAEEYYQAESRPADVVHDFRNNKDVNASDDFVFGENGNSLAFVIPNIFTEEECDEEAHHPKHRSFEGDVAAPHSSDPVEEFNSSWHTNEEGHE